MYRLSQVRRIACAGALAPLLVGTAFMGWVALAGSDSRGKRTTDADFAQVALAGLDEQRIGTINPVGVTKAPQRVKRLRIDTPGVYENILVDGEWSDERLVRITANGVVLRNCEIRNSTQNAIEVYADDVLIENCHIHHVVRGTFDHPVDAHGITGRPTRLVVRNCDIHHISGDALQFDPGRGAWDDVLIENCTLWTGPLEQNAAGFRKGERPGENAVDTKCDPANPRSRLVIRNCLFYGWKDGHITNQAALNLKEQIDATVENCVFRDNEICFRLRGDTGRGNANVRIHRCAIYSSTIGIRTEDRLANLRIDGLGFGHEVGRKMHIDRGVLGPGYEAQNEFTAPPEIETLLKGGVRLDDL